MLQCRSGHARTMPATLGLGDGPRAVTARTSPREPARRATAPRLRDRSGGPPARNTQHGGQRRDASEFGDGASCVLCLQRPLPLTLTIQFWGGDHFGVITRGSTVREGSAAGTDTTHKNFTTFYLNYLNQY